MSPLAFAVHVAALVVAVAGLVKVVDPTAVVRSLAAAGLPSHPLAGRVLGLTEVGAGAWVLAGGGRWSATALAALYVGFLAFIASNRVRGLDVPCGCLGDSTRPPGAAHWVIDTVSVLAAVAAVASPVGPATEWFDAGSAQGVGALVGIVVVAALVVVALESEGRRPRVAQ
ncbi:MAG: MauE/DoxX family redox-associated membrane protein [Acidimicrobiales bacterium]